MANNDLITNLQPLYHDIHNINQDILNGFGGSSNFGSTGPTGATGPIGNIGLSGSVGLKISGATGPTGSTGSIGSSGPSSIGINGISGSTGFTGPIGNDGINGFSPLGTIGQTGVSASDDNIGVMGISDDGSIGNMGDIGINQTVSGPTGSIGVLGNIGVTGPIGATGPAGPTGVSGPQGITGVTGGTGPTGVFGPANILTTEYLTATGAISTITQYSEITQYNFASTNNFTIGNGTTGQTKIIALGNNLVAPSQIQTLAGTYNLSRCLYPKSQLIFSQNRWNSLSDGLIWYPSQQQTGPLTGTGMVGASPYFGSAAGISADGNTMAIGALLNNSLQGGVWIFTQSNNTWTQQTGPIIPSDMIGNAFFGTDISLSADGKTMAISGEGDNSNTGAVWIYTYDGTTWTEQQKLIGSGATTSIYTSSVKLSGDGNTVAFGAYNYSTTGIVWVFVRNGTTWTQQGSPLIASGGLTQGMSVSLSADGNTLAVGAPDYNGGTTLGKTFIWTRSNNTWTLQTTNGLVGSGSIGTAVMQGISVALNVDGTVLAIGGTLDNSGVGATWIFNQEINPIGATGPTGPTWTQVNKLIGTGPTINGQGTLVKLSRSGNTLAIGCVNSNQTQSGIYIFINNNGQWTQKNGVLKGTGSTGPNTDQGSGLDISADGNILVVGGALDNSTGGVWTFV